MIKLKYITLILVLFLTALLMCSCDETKSISSENTSTGETTTTSQTIVTTKETLTTSVQESVQTSNSFISYDNAKLLYFSGCFDYDNSVEKLQTIDADIINKFISSLNQIEYTSLVKETMSSGGNWAEGFWDVNIYENAKVLYNVHAERNVIYIIDLTMPDAENNCTIITINDDIRHDFEGKAFDFSHKSWDDYENYFNEFWTEVSKIDTYGGVAFDDAWVILVASEEFSEYKAIESKYSEFHSFPVIKYKTVKHSLEELNSACKVIEQLGSEYSVYSVAVDAKKNKIIIYILQENEEIKEALIELSPVKDIEFILADEYLPKDNPST